MKKIVLILLIISSNQLLISQNKLAEKYNLMPWPLQIEATNTSFKIDSSLTIAIDSKQEHSRLRSAAIKFLRRLSNRTGVFLDKGFPVESTSAAINIHFNTIAPLTIEADESYSLTVTNNSIDINAKTDIGALRGLETLLQLTNFNASGWYFEGVKIKDAPRFVWRGLMIDASRHFQPLDVLKRNLDAMASVKLNVFHWHLTDDHGFRVESKVYPKLHEVASDGLYYTQEQIKDVVAYAANLGIRVIPEFDVPGHASAILAAYPELSSKEDYEYNVERFSGVFNPTLNPTKEKTYEFLENLFTEIAPLFPDEYFHIGGDENEGKHWDENTDIQKFKEQHDLKTNHDLQTYFNIKLEAILKKLGKKLMGWDEIMTPTMPTTAVIHSWRGKNEGLDGSTLIEAAKKGYPTVLSNGFYIDRMLSVAHHYKTEPIGDAQLTEAEKKRILGGEATMWSELVTPLTIDSRIWPRTAAIAERFWSPKQVKDVENMRHRLKDVNNKLEELGLTHIKNRDVILRNISNHQDISALKTLSNVCEPLKVYSRNAGGTEYKTYSPFTLFADACIADAPDAVAFNSEVIKFIDSKDKTSLDLITKQLKKWSHLNNELKPISAYPNIKGIMPLAENLSNISTQLIAVIQKNNLSEEENLSIQNTLNILKQPHLDVELAITEALKKLITFYSNTP